MSGAVDTAAGTTGLEDDGVAAECLGQDAAGGNASASDTDDESETGLHGRIIGGFGDLAGGIAGGISHVGGGIAGGFSTVGGRIAHAGARGLAMGSTKLRRSESGHQLQ